MASYPRGQRPHLPFPYYNEVMTGFEYVAGIHMLYEGLEEEGLRAISAIRARYDGRRRNPFDEAECGYHYARAMASWASVLALSGFSYSGLDHTLAIKSAVQDATYFWSNGHAWGTCRQQPTPTGLSVTLSILHGTLTLARLKIQGTGAVEYPMIRELQRGDQIACFIHNHESKF